MPSPTSASRMGNSMDTFGKAGISFDDHHFKDKEGKFQSSPPKEVDAHTPRPRPWHTHPATIARLTDSDRVVHAAQLTINHPHTGEPVTFIAQTPDLFAVDHHPG